jgi:hypothetical protein
LTIALSYFALAQATQSMWLVKRLCERFPSCRNVFIGLGYFALIFLGAVWFLNFPLAAYTLYVSHRYPLDYLGIGGPSKDSPPEAIFFPVALIFTALGIGMIYFAANALRSLRRKAAERKDSEH